ncbi:MAG: hypothetical protein AAF696_13345, partial [Bacteroidota bacterium]
MRLHLFEFEDQPWFPKLIRDYMTDFLQFAAKAFDIYKGITDIIVRGVKASGTNQILDMGSGGGGGWVKLAGQLQEELPDIKIRLSDFYPNVEAFEKMKKNNSAIDFVTTPVDARAVDPNLKGLRTQFLSLHHFRPEDAQKILQNAVDAKAPIAIFEAQERNIASFISMIIAPINVLVMTPFIKPVKLGRIIFTYLIPIVPIITLWDGLVSVLRIHSPKELKAIISQLENGDSFDWEIDRVKSGPAKILYVL